MPQLPKVLSRDQINVLVGLLVIIIGAFVPELRSLLDTIAPLVALGLFLLIGVPAIERSVTTFVQYRIKALDAELAARR